MQDAETDIFSGVHCSIYDSLVMTSSRTRFPSVREFTELHTVNSVMTYLVICFVIAIRTLDNLRLLSFIRNVYWRACEGEWHNRAMWWLQQVVCTSCCVPWQQALIPLCCHSHGVASNLIHISTGLVSGNRQWHQCTLLMTVVVNVTNSSSTQNNAWNSGTQD